MPQMLARRAVPLLLALIGLGCDSADAPSPPPSPAKPLELPKPDPTPQRPATFSTSDGVALTGDLYLKDEGAPAAILVHRQHGDRSEFSGLVARLREAPMRYTVLSFDRRGHGASKGLDGAPSVEAMTLDVEAAISHIREATGGKSPSVVLVGSSLGAALVSRAAFAEPKVTALALISPGAALEGVDVYRPYAEVRNLPTFIACANKDNVCREPSDALGRMAMAGTLKRYDVDAHGAARLAEHAPDFWRDVESWLMRVYDEAPRERRSLYFAPGKEPASERGKKRAPRASVQR